MTRAREMNGPGAIDDFVRAAKAGASKEPVATPKIRTVTDIPSIFTFASQQIEWVLEGVWPAGTVNALTGGSGDGKTTVSIAMASAIEQGIPFAGLATQRRPVLILDRENPLPVIVERYERFGIRDGENFRHWGGWCQEEPPDAAAAMITEWVISTMPRPVIFIDSLVAFHCGDENDAREVRAHMQGYRKLADYGATVIVLHHSGKGESTKDYRGSSDFKASLDVGYTVTNIGDPSRLESVRLKSFKARFSVNPEFVLRVRNGEFQADLQSSEQQTNVDILRALLIVNPRVTSTEFEKLAAAKRVGNHRTRGFLKSGVDNGSIDLEVGQNNAKYYTWLGPKMGS